MTSRIPFKKEEKCLALRIYKAIGATSVKKKKRNCQTFFSFQKWKLLRNIKTKYRMWKITIVLDACIFFNSYWDVFVSMFYGCTCIFEVKKSSIFGLIIR